MDQDGILQVVANYDYLLGALIALVAAGLGTAIGFVRFRDESALTRKTEWQIKRFLRSGFKNKADSAPSCFVPFILIRYHLGGYQDDELRRLLVRCGALRFTDANRTEYWALHRCLPKDMKRYPAGRRIKIYDVPTLDSLSIDG